MLKTILTCWEHGNNYQYATNTQKSHTPASDIKSLSPITTAAPN